LVVVDIDRHILTWNFHNFDGIDPERMWITRYFDPDGEGIQFCLYYLRMQRLLEERGMDALIDQYRGHMSSDCTRNKIFRWYNIITKLENKLKKAVAKRDLKTISSIKLGAEEGFRK